MGKTKKMVPFSKDGQPKYSEEDFMNSTRSTKSIRKEIANANRTLKKGKRQELKRELENILKEEY